MKSLYELIEQRNKTWNAARAFAESHQNAEGVMSDEDNATYERMESEIMNLSREINRMQRAEAMEAELNKPTSAPLTGKPDSTSFTGSGKVGRASDAYKSAMLTALRTNFKQVSNALQEGIDANGGYLVPSEWDSRLIDTLNEECIMRRLGTTITTSGEHKINVAATKPAAAWVEEGEALEFSDATFSQVILDAYKLSVAVKVSEELLYDSAFDLENYIIEQFATAISNAEEDAFLNGDGNNKPLGIFADNGGAQIGVTTDGTEISGDDIVDLVYSLKRPYRKNAAFILSDSTLAAIRKLKDSNGNYIWQPALSAGEPDHLLGYPVFTSQFAPTIEAGRPAIAFGDFSYYNLADRGSRSFAELRELFAGNGLIGMVCKERADGKLVLPESVQLLVIGGGADTEANG